MVGEFDCDRTGLLIRNQNGKRTQVGGLTSLNSYVFRESPRSDFVPENQQFVTFVPIYMSQNTYEIQTCRSGL